MSLSVPDTSATTLDFSQASTANYSVLLSSAKATTPTPSDSNWSTYWREKDPQAWSIVWDSQVPKKKTFYENLKNKEPVYFSFNTKDSKSVDQKDLVAMTEEQKANARKALQELSNVTGVQFIEKNNVKGGLVLALADLADSKTEKTSTMGEHAGAMLSVKDSSGKVTQQYQQTIVLNKWSYTGKSLQPGTSGFETLLHELGHAAGLDDAKYDLGKKYPNLDDTKYTLMSYGDIEEKNRTTYSELDKRAFEILYPSQIRPDETPIVKSAGSQTLLSAASGLDYLDEYDDDLEDELEALAGTQGSATSQTIADTGQATSGEGTTYASLDSLDNDSSETVVGVTDEPAQARMDLKLPAGFVTSQEKSLEDAAGSLWLGLAGKNPVAGLNASTTAAAGLLSADAANGDAIRRILAQG